jgi:hypothetical protein
MRQQMLRHFSRPSLAALAAAALVLAGCATPGEISAGLGEEFILSVGQSAGISGEGLRITFNEVVSDSRCPSDVTCIWQGEVSCRVEIEYAGSSYPMVLTQPGLTAAPSQKDFEAYRFGFSVDPYPESRKEIRPEDYRLNLIVDRIG